MRALVLLLVAAAAVAQGRLAGPVPRRDVESWRHWWEYNREELIGYRHVLRRHGGDESVAKDPLGKYRPEVLKQLRLVAKEGDKPNRRNFIVEVSLGDRPYLRAAAIVALGRAGEDRDADLFIQMMRHVDERGIIRQAAAVALLALPPITDTRVRDRVRKKLDDFLKEERELRKKKDSFGFVTMNKILPSITHALALIAAGRRARDDPALAMSLGEAVRRTPKTRQHGMALGFGMGLSRATLLLPEIDLAVRTASFGREEYGDVGRAHFAYGLAGLGAPAGGETLRQVMLAEKTGLQTRRAGALGLGRLLRAGVLADADARRAADALAVLLRHRDPILAGFAAVALGGAPAHIPTLITLLYETQPAARRTYVALALGLAARRAPTPVVLALRNVLLEALREAKDTQFVAALCIAVGLARDPAAIDVLADHAAEGRHVVRRAAAEGLGHIRSRSTRAADALLEAVRSGEGLLIEDAAVALGMLGSGDVAGALEDRLRGARGSTARRSRRVPIFLASARLGHPGAVRGLLVALRDPDQPPRAREAAAVALGMLGDARAEDPLWSAHAGYNFYARSNGTQYLTLACGGYVLRSAGERR